MGCEGGKEKDIDTHPRGAEFMTEARRLEKEELAAGYTQMACKNHVFVFKASVLKSLPKEYQGEWCNVCDALIVDKRKFKQVEAAPETT